MNTAQTARDRLIEQNMGLVHACCHRMTGKGIEYDDLFSAGCLGLCKAAQRFDPALGNCFSTYAVPVILGELRRLFRDGGSIKVSRTLKELSMKINRLSPRLAKELGREPTLTELATALEVTEDQVIEASCAARPVLSLTRTDDAGTEEWDVQVESHEEEFCNRHALYQTVNALPEEERALITLRYFEGKTQAITAKELGLTQVQVSRKERVILSKMRKAFL
ncbi:MAG: sigma-70 family RNA polymerase sigma factor [Clostridia bacterium]|nr:sigma-70 family RNA polymerase sigma factor [Clostridia bacterium]